MRASRRRSPDLRDNHFNDGHFGVYHFSISLFSTHFSVGLLRSQRMGQQIPRLLRVRSQRMGPFCT